MGYVNSLEGKLLVLEHPKFCLVSIFGKCQILGPFLIEITVFFALHLGKETSFTEGSGQILLPYDMEYLIFTSFTMNSRHGASGFWRELL